MTAPSPYADVAARLRHWLLHGPAQQRTGAHAGGVAGTLDAAGQAQYVYPEITGYYLHWLAEAAPHEPRAREAAQLAVEWSAREFANGRVPQTRAYFDTSVQDWRNDAVFFFDLAMLLRGVCAAHEAGLTPWHAEVGVRVVEALSHLIDHDGHLLACRALRANASLPGRWSTLGGPFEVKATSRVALASRHLALPTLLTTACAREDRMAARAETIALDMLHPTLYFAEGALVAMPEHAPRIAILLRRCLALQRADGTLPESESDSDLPRSDIIAQALRVGLLLRASEIPGAPDDTTLQRLADALVARVSDAGTLSFVPDQTGVLANAWCAMFAEQALRWYAHWRRGEALPDAEWLV